MTSELGLSAAAIDWLGGIRRAVDVPAPILPDDVEADELLIRLDVDPEDRRDVLAARPGPQADPALWWVLDRVYQECVTTMGDRVPIEGHPGHPALPGDARYVPVWVYLALVPAIRLYHKDRGIPDDISWYSLAEAFGQTMRSHRQFFGVSGIGFGGMGWTLALRFRGADYQLGKLGFNRGAISLSNGACGYALSTHIAPQPPLDAASCDASFARARDFFTQHFPEEPVSFFTCHSWLLDPQLADSLPESSNIVRFQRRFHLLPLASGDEKRFRDDIAVMQYLFGRSHQGPDIPTSLLEELRCETTLQRAYVEHIRAGGHWHARTGWMPF